MVEDEQTEQTHPAAEDGGGELRTFLIADVRGYTRYTQAHGDEAAAELAARFADGARAAVAENAGRVVELRGDEALAVFTSPRRAVRAAIDVQRRLRGALDGADALPLGVGIGLDAGEAVPVEDGYRGKALNVAARLCSLAKPGEVLLTDTLSALAGRVPGVRFAPRKAVRVKGIEEPIRLVEAVPEDPLPPLPEPPGAAPPTRRRVSAAVAGLAVLVVAVIAGFLLLGDEGEAAALGANSLGRLDTGDARVRDEIRVGADPTDVVFGAGSLWVVNEQDASVSRIAPATGEVTLRPDVGSAPVAAAFGDGALWVLDPTSRRLLRMDAVSLQITKRYPVGNGASSVAFAAGAAWVGNAVDGTLTRLHARSERSRTTPVGVEPVAIAAGADAVWVADRSSDTVARVGLGSGTVESIPVGHEPVALTVAAGHVWVANAADRTVWKISAQEAPYTVRETYQLASRPTAIEYADGALWVASSDAGTVARVDDDGVETHVVGGAPTALQAAEGSLWVTALASRATHRGGTLRVSGGFPVTDPAVPSFGANINPIINDGLLGFRASSGPSGTSLVPDLARSIPQPTEGGRRYAFTLRSGIRYSTGREVRASDVRATLERLFRVNPDAASLFAAVRGAKLCRENAASCDLSDGVVADDQEGTVTFVLEHADPLLLYKLAFPFAGILPPDVPQQAVETTPLPATGPYRIAQVVADRSMTLVRNPYFREWSHDAQPAGYPDRIVIDVERNAFDRVVAGRADVVFGDPPRKEVEQLAVRMPTRVRSVPRSTLFLAVLNTNVKPFSDPRARTALALAVNRAAAVRALGGPAYARPACQVLTPNLLGYRPYCPSTRAPAAGVWRGVDLAAARRLVRRSGTSGAAVTVWTSEDPMLRALSSVLATTLNRLGYDVRERVVPGNRFDYYDALRSSRTAQIGPLRWGYDFPVPADAFGAILTCDGFNATKFCDRRFDRRIGEATELLATDRARAAHRWIELDREAVDRALVVPLATGNSVDVVSGRVGNVRVHPHWGPMYSQMWVR